MAPNETLVSNPDVGGHHCVFVFDGRFDFYAGPLTVCPCEPAQLSGGRPYRAKRLHQSERHMSIYREFSDISAKHVDAFNMFR